MTAWHFREWLIAYKKLNTVWQARRRSVLTYTEDVEAKSLCDRFTDQLVREAVKSNMSAQTEVTLLFVLRDANKNKTKH